jgi:predicted DNA-binding transcriptional regulator AlpA
MRKTTMHSPQYAEPLCGAGVVPLAVPLPRAPDITGLSRSTIYREAARGNIRLLKAGRSTLVDMASVRAFLASLPTASICAAQQVA